MSASGTITDPHDDDVLLVFRRGKMGQRRKSERMSWKDAKAAIMAALPDSSEAIEEIHFEIEGVSKAAASALLAETRARGEALAAEAKARDEADRAEAKARADADKALADRQTHASSSLTLAAGLSLLAGKMTRALPIPALKAGDNLNVTFRTALPSGLTLGECYCAKDGELSIVLLAIGPVSITARTDLPFSVAVLRPPA